MKRPVAAVLLVAAAATLLFGMVQILMLRFEQGNVYPAYSSLRSDPLGSRAFYESLERISGITVQRDYSTENHLPDTAATTYLHLAGEAGDWERLPLETVREIERFATSGGRLVIALYPVVFRRPPPEKPKTEPAPKTDEDSKSVNIKDRWGVNIDYAPLQAAADRPGGSAPVVNASDRDLPGEIDWHSGLVLTGLSTAWQPIYTRAAGTVMAERRFGKGAVVIATDCYFVSNEALQKDRNPKLLAWLIGPNRHVVFDEAHLGVTESPGVATLIRRYRLQGLVLSLLLLAGLFVWKNSVSLLPRAAVPADRRMAGKDAASGFVNLLRRNIAPNDLLAACYAEWKASAAPAGAHSARRIAEAEAVFSADASRAVKDRDPVGTYKAIAAILHNKRKSPTTL